MKRFLQVLQFLRNLVDTHIKRIFSGTFITATCTISSCFLTVMYGTDAVNPTPLTFLTDSEESAKLWVQELRHLSVKFSKEIPILGVFEMDSHNLIPKFHIVDALIPPKNKEDRKEVERLLKSLPAFSEK
uniref:PLC-beta PH domain-containing protein n=1 Tax=Parascaris equorum TaxID=6256 RepID=A0A914RF72_PAREQ